MRRLLACASSAIALLAAGPEPPTATAETRDGLRIVELRVNGGAPAWTPDNRFQLSWSLAAPPGTTPLASVMYQVLDPSLRVIVPTVPLSSEISSVDDIRIPEPGRGLTAEPGEYTARIWLQTSDGYTGPASTIALRFDDRRPGAAIPQPPPGWIRGDAEAQVRIVHPGGPPPVSGIRGYAVSVRPGSAGQPCAGPDRCGVEETDLRGGIGEDLIGIGPGVLAEGLHVVSVVAVANSGMRSQIVESAPIRVDATRPELTLSGAGTGWSNQPVRVLARASDALSGMAPAGPAGPRTAIAVDGGAAVVAQGEEAAIVVAGSGVHSVAASARDGAGNVRGDGPSAPPRAIVRIDEAAPTVSFARSGDPDRPELIEATVADALSGPAEGRGSIGVRALGAVGPFEPLPTVSEAGRLTAHWDSDAYPKGAYEFRATGYDRAGNAASSSLRANGARMALVNPVKVPAAIRFGFGGRELVWQRCVRRGEGRRCHREVTRPFARRPARRTVPYGQGHRVGGRLVSASGAPLAGLEVELVERFAGGAQISTRTTRVETDGDGAFLAHLGPGPSREVEARFAGNRLLTRGASRRLQLAVQSSVRLRASTAQVAVGGAPVLFSGKVGDLEATIPSYGRPVQLQFRLPGMPWTEFRTVQTDAQGRFHYPYSFSDDDSRGVRFLFRAYAPPQPGWPYEPGVSRPVAVTGY